MTSLRIDGCFLSRVDPVEEVIKFSDKFSFDAHTDTTIKTKYVIGLCAGAPRIQHPTPAPTVSLSSVFPVSFDV